MKAKAKPSRRPAKPANLDAATLARYQRFDRFLKTLWSDVYPETTTLHHEQVIAAAWGCVKELFPMPPGTKVLDIGCGQGVAMDLFQADKLDAIGIALGEDVAICRARGLNVVEMDLSFLDFPDGTFDFVWCRHVLEHSVFPYFSLKEIHRVLKPQGGVYIEVPAPDTDSRHQNNPNHYSVLGRSMWLSLIERAGFSKALVSDLPFTTPSGDDLYWSFFVAKGAVRPMPDL